MFRIATGQLQRWQQQKATTPFLHIGQSLHSVHSKRIAVPQVAPVRLYRARSSANTNTNNHNPNAYHPTVLQAAYPIRRSLYALSTVILLSLSYLYITDTRSSFHQYISPRLLRLLYPSAEDAHHAGVSLLKTLSTYGLAPRERVSEPYLSVQIFGHELNSPLAISAGLDKDGEIVSELFALGPSIVEIGGVTLLPQPGNPRPRVWRLPSQESMINRYGLNSHGALYVAKQLHDRISDFAARHGLAGDPLAEKLILGGEAGVPPGSLTAGKLLAVQIAKNKSTPDSDLDAVARDYSRCVELLGPYADILVVNVSSPNTAGLRALQSFEPLAKILGAVTDALGSLPARRGNPPRVIVKISPDEDSDAQILGICHAVFASNVDGVIVGNTTKTRPPLNTLPGLTAEEALTMEEDGGFSGPSMFPKTLSLVKRYRKVLDEGSQATKQEPKLIFASGGITSGKDVLDILDAGASVAMTYTGLTYGGVGFIGRLKREMGDIIRKKGANRAAEDEDKTLEQKAKV